MQLTLDEQRMLDGDYGVGASRMVPVTRTHVALS